jgi:ferric-dicitrate binding protein FerR (iron transport regulator)
MTPDWHDLIQRHLAGLCTQEECESLHAALLRDDAIARLYLRYANLDLALESQANSSEFARSLLLRDLQSTTKLPRSRWSFFTSWRNVAAAASILALAAAGIFQKFIPHSDRQLADLVESQGARWKSCSLPTEIGSRLSAGVLRLSDGIARLRFAHGAEVTLEGPAELELVTPQICRLLQGSLVAHVPEPARGFTVLTPSAQVIDHGTDFGVSTDAAGHAQVQVMQGEVELRHASGTQPLRLNTREMAAITPTSVLAPVPFQAEPRRAGTVGLERIFNSEITTRVGRGEAVYVAEPRTENNQSSTVLLLKHCLEEGYGRKVLLRFDLSALPKATVLTSAQLTLHLDPSGYGYASQGDDARIVAYALTREESDFWSANELNWQTQPAFDPSAGRVNESEAVRVGEFTVPRGVQTGMFVLEDPRLLERIQSDPNRLLTLILVRENPITVGGGLVLGIAGNRHPTLAPPRLSVR